MVRVTNRRWRRRRNRCGYNPAEPAVTKPECKTRADCGATGDPSVEPVGGSAWPRSEEDASGGKVHWTLRRRIAARAVSRPSVVPRYLLLIILRPPGAAATVCGGGGDDGAGARVRSVPPPPPSPRQRRHHGVTPAIVALRRRRRRPSSTVSYNGPSTENSYIGRGRGSPTSAAVNTTGAIRVRDAARSPCTPAVRRVVSCPKVCGVCIGRVAVVEPVVAVVCCADNGRCRRAIGRSDTTSVRARRCV